MPVAPKYVSTHWLAGNFEPYPDGPEITPQGVYIEDQTTLDAVFAAAARSNVELFYSDTGPTPPQIPEPDPFVRFDRPQTFLSPAEQAQARANIGLGTGVGGALTIVDVDAEIDAKLAASPAGSYLEPVSYSISALSSWSHVHSFPYLPAVRVLDDLGDEVSMNVHYPDSSHVALDWPAPFTGTVILS